MLYNVYFVLAVLVSACSAKDFTCRDGGLINEEFRCDVFRDCLDGSDEEGCPATPAPVAAEPLKPLSATTEASGIVPRRRRTPRPAAVRATTEGSGIADRCLVEDTVLCAEGSKFICEMQVCDGETDCPGGTDEQNCPNECAVGEMVCDSARCIPSSQRCDGVANCADDTDERDCPQFTDYSPSIPSPLDDNKTGNSYVMPGFKHVPNRTTEVGTKEEQVHVSV